MMTSLLLLAGAMLGYEAPAEASELLVGDPAPAIVVQEFIKGEPIEAFAKDQVYVLEFWATWCGPCRRSMPHLSKLQAQFKDVIFIAVDVMDDDLDESKTFVEAMGEQMDFRVAFDKPGEGKTPDGEAAPGKMATTWLDASYRSGIPATFIVDGTGVIAWIGHPLELEEPLAAVLEGKWDIASERKDFRGKIAAKRIEQQLNAAFAEGDAAGMNKLADEFIAAFPDQEPSVAIVKLMALLAPSGDPQQADLYVTHLIDKVLTDDWRALLSVAGFIAAAGSDRTAELPESLRPQPGGKSLLALALTAAERATKLAAEESGEAEAAARDTLARVYFMQGQIDKALQEQETAIGLTKGTRLEGEPGMTDRLSEYRKASKPAEAGK